MIELMVRPFFQKRLFDPVASLCDQWHLTPNHLTAMSLVIGLMSPVLLTMGHPIGACLLLWLSGLADVLDGSLARLQGAGSDWGAVVDNISDRLVEFSVVLGLLLINPAQRAVLCFAMGMSIAICVTSFLLVGMFTQNQSQKAFYYSPGLIERAEAFVLWSAMFLFERHFAVLAILFTALTFYTAGHRLFSFYQQTHHPSF